MEPPTIVAPNDAWATMLRLQHEFAQMPRSGGTLAEQLERDRNEREAALIGHGEENVHTRL